MPKLLHSLRLAPGPSRPCPHQLSVIYLALSGILLAQNVQAVEIDVGNPNLKMRWDSTVKYSAGYRLKDPSPGLLADVNLDDGDRNFGKGLNSSRVDLLMEMDLTATNYGMRVSGATWYDSVYNRSNNNNSPATSNSVSVPHNKFTATTTRAMGRDAELLDAFIYGKGEIAGLPGTLRFGRHSIIYGETLFFGANGIANAQGPIDLVKLLNVPGSQFKEILRPVNQISGQLQIQPNLSVGGYYQLEWRATRLPPVGSYLSIADFVGEGAERLLLGAPLIPGGGAAAFWQGENLNPKNRGQGGIKIQYTPADTDLEFGFYAARYSDKTPSGIYFDVSNPAAVNPGSGQIGTLRQAFAENIKTFGASLSTVVSGVNVAAEVSVRRNTPLVSDPQTILPGMVADNNKHPLYAVGNTLHANLSAIYVFTPNSLLQGGSLLGELAWNHRSSVTKNAAALDPHTTRDATAMRMVFEPAYFQVIQDLDITLPIGLGYNVDGRSSTIGNFNGGSSHGGDLSLGLKGTYQQVWKIALNYVRYLGDEGTFLTPPNSPAPVLSYLQSLKDRDFVSFSLQRTF